MADGGGADILKSLFPDSCRAVGKPFCLSASKIGGLLDTIHFQDQSIPVLSGHVWACLDFELSTSETRDSTIWSFRSSEALSLWIKGNMNPRESWVRIGQGGIMWDTSHVGIWWQTNWCEAAEESEDHYSTCDPTDFYTVVAWIYYQSGKVCHSEPLKVLIVRPTRDR